MALEIGWWRMERDKERMRLERRLAVIRQQERDYTIHKLSKLVLPFIAALAAAALVAWIA